MGRVTYSVYKAFCICRVSYSELIKIKVSKRTLNGYKSVCMLFTAIKTLYSNFVYVWKQIMQQNISKYLTFLLFVSAYGNMMIKNV